MPLHRLSCPFIFQLGITLHNLKLLYINSHILLNLLQFHVSIILLAQGGAITTIHFLHILVLVFPLSFWAWRSHLVVFVEHSSLHNNVTGITSLTSGCGALFSSHQCHRNRESNSLNCEFDSNCAKKSFSSSTPVKLTVDQVWLDQPKFDSWLMLSKTLLANYFLILLEVFPKNFTSFFNFFSIWVLFLYISLLFVFVFPYIF